MPKKKEQRMKQKDGLDCQLTNLIILNIIKIIKKVLVFFMFFEVVSIIFFHF
jgi:hypothetical protein